QHNRKKLSDDVIVTVVIGAGINSFFESLGASVVIAGGQTMNPSTQDLTDAINEANAEQVIILPNNKNITMAAEQAAEIADKEVGVVPTRSIPQGISALLAFHPESELRSEEHTSELQSRFDLVCRLLLEKK